jgi:hypothetical protein
MKKGEIKAESTYMSYLANRVNDVMQRPQHHVQGTGCEFDPSLDLLPILPLRAIIEHEERRPQVSPVGPPEDRPLPRVQIAARMDQISR